MKNIFYHLRLKGQKLKTTHLLCTVHLKARWDFTKEHLNKDKAFDDKVLRSDEKKLELFRHSFKQAICIIEERTKVICQTTSSQHLTHICAQAMRAQVCYLYVNNPDNQLVCHTNGPVSSALLWLFRSVQGMISCLMYML